MICIKNLLPNPGDVLGGNGAGKGGYVSSQELKAEGLFPVDDPDDHWWIPSGRIFFSLNNDDTSLDELTYAIDHFFLPHRYNDPFGNTTMVTFDSQNFFIIIKVVDPVGNVVLVGDIDFRLLQPFLVTDLTKIVQW